MMPTAVDIYVPTEETPAGAVVELYGPDAAGNVDLTAAAALGTALKPAAGYEGFDAEQLRLRLRGLIFGLKKFAARIRDRDTHATAGGSPVEGELFVNAAPTPPNEMAAIEQVISGKHRFTFAGGELT